MVASLDPKLIPLHKKKQYLSTFSEDDFRDKVIRPLYLMQGLEHGKETCGSDEEGKDCYFWDQEKIRGRVLIAVQTKKGDLKLSSKARDNLLNATTQVKTALETEVYDSLSKTKWLPSYVVLAASGEINNAARRHVAENIRSPNVVFQDANNLIPMIDETIPEFWNGIDAKTLPYLKQLRDYLIKQSIAIDVSALGVDDDAPSPITDESFAPLFLARFYPKSKKISGQFHDRIEIEEIPIEKLLDRKERMILVTGDAGSGKSTSIFRLAFLLVDRCLQSSKDKRVPVVITAQDLFRSQVSLAHYAGNHTKNFTPDNSAAFTVEELTNGEVEIFVDGLDEIGHEDQREVVLKRIQEFHKNYPKCKLIVASRDYSFIKDVITSYDFTRFRLTPISYSQATKMVDRLSKGQSLAKTDTVETLRRLENIHGLELNPLLITVFVATSDYSRSDIPANITEIFKKFTEVMLGRWGKSKGLSHQYHAPLKDFLLQRIAFVMHSRNDNTIQEGECRALIETELRERGHEADVDIIFDEIVNRSGLLRQHECELSFPHHLLQEFFAGRAIPSVEFLGRVVSDLWWTKAIVFYFGENPDDSNGLKALRDGLQGVIGADEFQSAITVGLAAQACYLMKSNDKSDAVRWVVKTLSNCKTDAVNDFSNHYPGMEIMPLVFYYMYGRDAVAAKVISDVAAKFQSEANEDFSKLNEVEAFWCIAGLLEARHLEQALEYIKKYNPSETKLLLALHIGAKYVSEIHVTSKQNKRIAKEIVAHIEPRIEFMFPDVVKELKGLLLEMQMGKVVNIEAKS